MLKAKIAPEAAKLKKARSAKTTRTKGRKPKDSAGDERKTIKRFPTTTIARYTTNFQEASILNFCNMLYSTAMAIALTTA
jgi:hypothetical protein